MKIYNEIVIDMNPESSSYGETLHEDSFEYSGDIIFLQAEGETLTTEKDWIAVFFNAAGDEIDSETWAKLSVTGKEEYSIKEKRYPVYKFTNGAWVKQETHAKDQLPQHYSNLSDAPSGKFGYTAGKFDPTSAEFRASVEETGGLEELIKGYGQDPSLKEFGEFYDAPLTALEETKTEGLRSAGATYQTGMVGAGLTAGKSLFDIKQQTDVATVKSDFATQGIVTSAGQAAKSGVFQDYTLQQKKLAEGLVSAQTAIGIDYRQDVSDFWKDAEDDFYERRH